MGGASHIPARSLITPCIATRTCAHIRFGVPGSPFRAASCIAALSDWQSDWPGRDRMGAYTRASLSPLLAVAEFPSERDHHCDLHRPLLSHVQHLPADRAHQPEPGRRREDRHALPVRHVVLGAPRRDRLRTRTRGQRRLRRDGRRADDAHYHALRRPFHGAPPSAGCHVPHGMA